MTESEPDPPSFKKLRTDPDFKGVGVQIEIKALYMNKYFDKDSRYSISLEVLKMVPIVIYSRSDALIY